jgi:hypothetical protein
LLFDPGPLSGISPSPRLVGRFGLIAGVPSRLSCAGPSSATLACRFGPLDSQGSDRFALRWSPTAMGAVTTAVFDNTCGNLIQIAGG